LANVVLSIDFASPGGDGVGVVFGRTAADEYLYFLASEHHGYHLVGRRTPAGWQTLGSAPGRYRTDAESRLVLTVFDGTASVELDGRRTLRLVGMPSIAGEIGLLTHGNATARFSAGRVMALE
jgi:hypothetical protein